MHVKLKTNLLLVRGTNKKLICFPRNGQVELGKKVVEALYFTPLLLNHPYDSDVRYWHEAGVLGKSNSMDKGLYTGQTLLHIAINLRNPELVITLVAPSFMLLAFSRQFFPTSCVTLQKSRKASDLNSAGIDLWCKCWTLP